MNESKSGWTTRRNDRGDRWRVWKGVGFWTFLALASFTFGLLVVSPLINAAKGSPNEESPQRTVSVPQPQPQVRSEQLPAQEPAPRRQRRAPGPDLTLTPEKDDTSVQKPENVDNNRTDSPNRADANPNNTDDSSADRQGQTTNGDDRPARRTRRSRSRINESDDPSVRAGDASTADREQGSEPRRARRGRTSEAGAADSGDRSTGVQKGEPIDR